MRSLVFVLCLGAISAVRAGFGPNNQDWGYVTVRDRAHMFWWLHYTTAVNDYTQRPLVIWLQGGPGASSTGVGNFHEIGPWDMHQQDRNLSWVKFLNVLFVDNPVGTGFSYVEDSNDHSLFAANNTVIAQDFLVLLQNFLNEKSEFQDVPLYIFGQSYGGKMAADIALLLHREIEAGNINCNLKGIGLGDPWISPIDSLTSWPSYLLNLGFIDTEGYNMLKIVTDTARNIVNAGDFAAATRYFQATQVVLNRLTTVDFYNVLNEKLVRYTLRNSDWNQPVNSQDITDLLGKLNIDLNKLNLLVPVLDDHEDVDEELLALMTGPVSTSLNLSSIPIAWGDQSELVFKAVDVDFMKPVTEVIETILNTTNIEVTVYNGQLDLIVDTPGTVKWMDNLNWAGAEQWRNANRSTITVDNVCDGFVKSYGNFNFYWINRAGHAVPTDNPNAMEYVLRQTTHDYNMN